MQNLRPRPLHAQIHFQLLPYGASNAMNSGPGRVELGSQDASQSQLFFYHEYQNILFFHQNQTLNMIKYQTVGFGFSLRPLVFDFVCSSALCIFKFVELI